MGNIAVMTDIPGTVIPNSARDPASDQAMIPPQSSSSESGP